MPAPFSSEETLAEAVTPWAVTASHTNLDQAISSSTNVTLSDGTVGNYNEGLLFADHRISLPLPGTITHFVSPQQPTFTFTQPTRVFMFIPTTTNVAPIRREGWVYIPQGLSGSASPFLNFPVPVLDELFSGVISSVNYDYCYEKFFTAGTYNLDPNALAPEAFYLFEELIDGNVLSELRQRQMYVFEEGVLPGAPGGNYGIGTTNPSAKLHVVGDIKASGSGNIIASGDITATDSGSIIEVGKNTDGVSHINRARIESASFGPGSIVSWSHHDCSLGSNLALAQSNEGETLLNSESNKSLQFRIGGLEKMRVHSNGFVGINQTSPAEALDVGGSIKATGHLHKLISTQEQNSVVITKDNHDLLGIAGSKGAGLIIHGDATSLNAYGGSLAITGSQVNQGGLGPFFEFLGSRSTYDQLASGTHTAVTDGDVLGYFRWMGDDGNDCRSRAADISCEIDGTVAENTVPGAIRFSTRNSSNYGERMRLSATGNVGIGTTSPDYKLDVNGSFKAHTVETNRLYASAYNLSAISPDVWALAGDTTAYEGGGAITKSSAVSVKNLNGIPFWFFGDNDSDVTISNTIATGNTWTIALAITKKPESHGVIFAQLPLSETAHGSENNHRIAWTGSINGDEYRPSGGGWNSGGYISIPDESTLIVRRNGTGANSISVFLNGGLVYQAQYTENYSGPAVDKIRLGQINRYSNYQNQTPLYMGIAAVAAWSSVVSDNNIRKFVNYQSLTTKA